MPATSSSEPARVRPPRGWRPARWAGRSSPAIGVDIHSCVIRIGDVHVDVPEGDVAWDVVERSPVRCADEDASGRMVAAIDAARENGNTLGGTAYVSAANVPAGLGSYVHWDRRLDGLIAQAMCSIPSVKGVGVGCRDPRGSIAWFGGARRATLGCRSRFPSPDQPARAASPVV